MKQKRGMKAQYQHHGLLAWMKMKKPTIIIKRHKWFNGKSLTHNKKVQFYIKLYWIYWIYKKLYQETLSIPLSLKIDPMSITVSTNTKQSRRSRRWIYFFSLFLFSHHALQLNLGLICTGVEEEVDEVEDDFTFSFFFSHHSFNFDLGLTLFFFL